MWLEGDGYGTCLETHSRPAPFLSMGGRAGGEKKKFKPFFRVKGGRSLLNADVSSVLWSFHKRKNKKTPRGGEGENQHATFIQESSSIIKILNSSMRGVRKKGNGARSG